jgi:hypothetical protein
LLDLKEFVTTMGVLTLACVDFPTSLAKTILLALRCIIARYGKTQQLFRRSRPGKEKNVAELDVYKEWLGIPEGDRPPDLYTLLRVVQFEDDAEKIQNNYRKLNAHVRKYATGQYLKESQDLLNEMAKAMLCLTDPDSKRDYDESQGREFQPDQSEGTDTVLQYLVSHKVIKRAQVSEIEHFAEARGISHRDAVVQMKLAEPSQATRALAAELRLSYVDLADMLPEDEALDQLPRQVVKRHTCLPLFEDRGKLMVACVDEPSPELEDEIRMRYGMPMRASLAVPRSIQQAIAKYYAKGMRDEAVAEAAPVKSGKAAKGAVPKPKKAKASAVPISDEDKAQRKQISLIIICWSLIGTIMGIHSLALMGTGGMITTGVVVAAVVTGILKLTYWK